MMKRMQAWLATNLGADPARVAYTLQVGRTNLRSRAAIVAEDLESFADQIEAYLAGQPHRFHLCEDVLASPAAPQDRGTAPEAVARAWANGQSINWHALWGVSLRSGLSCRLIRSSVSAAGTRFSMTRPVS